MIERPVRHRDVKHLQALSRLRCLACALPGGHAHHLTHAQPKARGLKAGDQWTVPICARCHDALHRFGNERAWWDRRGIDPLVAAERLWNERIQQVKR